MYTANDYTEQIILNKTWRKCFSARNNERLLDFLIGQQWIPSQVSIDRALTQLQFRRTDGGSERTDAQAAINAAQRNLDAVIMEAAASPLTRQELDHFASLSPTSLQKSFWGEENDGINTFAVRYRKAAAEHGFQIPARPQIQEEVADDELPLDAKTYHAMRAQEVCRRLQTEPRFKRAVDRLIKAGQIALVFGLLHGGLLR
jgi:hypothetical protein